MTTRKESSGNIRAVQSSWDRCIRPGQAQSSPDPRIARGGGREVHSQLSYCRHSIAVGSRRGGFISPIVVNG